MDDRLNEAVLENIAIVKQLFVITVKVILLDCENFFCQTSNGM
jgi:hypothetical protein